MKNEPIIIVSGLPRSGTSLVMQMLEQGGVEAVTDNVRKPDRDNPRGYYELQKTLSLEDDNSWLHEMRGKAVKVVSPLLYDLLFTEKFKVLFVQRDIREILASQAAMLGEGLEDESPDAEMAAAFQKHLAVVLDWLNRQSNMEVLTINYMGLIAAPAEGARIINEFLGGGLDEPAMARAVDPTLYRRRLS
ncbi:sulfotransferase domain-containing protein [Desulfatibacillum aliphaticivorans]|uniref:sulfotransferase domain-containing protein n=1 Tax=Desulfatibacillum aliphaticivorans TaxID=218208 RepID=UPI0001601B32|nr:sulfotransferase domain-containing protein [Desulfatibacillum aliphaticivorans]